MRKKASTAVTDGGTTTPAADTDAPPATLETVDLDGAAAEVEIQSEGSRSRRLRLVWVDPHDLIANPRNVRRNLGDLTEQRDAIAEKGVLLTLLGFTDEDGSITLADGHRRAAAAVLAVDELGSELAAEVPVLLDENLAGKTDEQIAAMLQTSIHALPLTASEEAAGYQQLTLEGWTTEQIVTRIGRKRAHVEKSLALARQNDTVQTAVDAGRLTLEDAAALAEFDDDPKAQKRILSKTDSWSFRHQLDNEQRKRRTAAAIAALTTELEQAGVVIVARPKNYPHGSREVAVTKLTDEHGEPLDPEQVRARPGFAAFIDDTCNPVRAVVICLNPEAHGYQPERVIGTGTAMEERRRRDEEERAARQARQAALEAAATVRESFLMQTYGSAKAAKRLYVHALRFVLLNVNDINDGEPELVKKLTGIDPEGDLSQDGEARLSRLLVGLWIAAEHANVDQVGIAGWGRKADAVAWLDGLVADGYTLSDAEQELRDKLAGKPEAAEAQPFALVRDDDNWNLLDQTGGQIASFTDPDDDTEAVTAWATAVLKEHYGRSVTAWLPDEDGEDFVARLIAETATDDEAGDLEAEPVEDEPEPGDHEPAEDDAEPDPDAAGEVRELATV